jgi:hypothetical protein
MTSFPVLASMAGATNRSQLAISSRVPKPIARKPDRTVPAASAVTVQNIVPGASPCDVSCRWTSA